MEQIIVTHLDTTTLKLNSAENISRIIKAEQTVELLGQDVVNVTVESARKMIFSLGDKITVVGRDYTLNTPPVERKFSETRFTYELQFEGVQYDMLRASFSVNVDTTNNQIQDLSGNSLTGDMKLFLDVLMANLNRVFPSKWVLGVYPTNTETRTETFSDTDNCLSVLQSLCSQDRFNTEFDIEISETGVRTLNIRQTGKIHAHTFSYGKGKGVYELSRQKVSNSNIINRLWVFGGSKNILTTRYRAFKLCLPLKGKGSSYLEDAASIAKYGVWEGTKNFDDIFPTRTGSITALGSDELEFIDTSMDFDLNETDVNDNTIYLMAGAKAKIRFKTGNLAGFEFEIESYDHATKKFRLLPQTDENDYTFPSPDSAAFRFSVTDQYTITDIALPQSYETAAEEKLEDAGEAYLAKFSQPLVSYGLRLDPRFLRDIAGEDVDSNIIWVGDFIAVLDTDLDVDKTIRVKGFTRDLMNPYAYDLTIADLTVSVTTISRVITDLNDVVNVIKINNLKDPARARRNWLAAQELLNMVFDVEGDYYTDKIKPASIDTIMLSVGAKSMQFGLIGTVFQPNYAGNANRIVYRGGTLQHYTIDPNGAKSWTLTDGDVTFPLSTTAYYIYAKVQRSGTAGSILFSTSQISVEQDGSYYHFWIGVISSVDSLLNTRLISLTYGFTTINGRYISTGRIQSADGLTYFDLDEGVIQGTLKFSSGQPVEDAIQDVADAVEANVSITGVDVEFAQNTNPLVAPTTGWSTTPPAWVDGSYIWSRTTTHFSDNTYTTTTPVNITGGKGTAGRGISDIQEQYYLSDSDTTQTGGAWSTTPPAWEEGKFIWTRIRITYTDPTEYVYTTPVLASEWGAIQQAHLAAEGYMNARYIRDWLNGWSDENGTDGADNRFNEIQVFLKDNTNIALSKTVTTNGTNNASYPLTRVTDGDTLNYAIPTITAGEACYVQVDLGKVYYDISHIIVFHDASNGKTFFGTKTEISMDGVNWFRIFDSGVQGRYKEGTAGHRISMLKRELYAKTVENEAKNKFMTTIDGGLIYTALMKLFDTQGLNESAFISGQQGDQEDLPAFGAGGTYANALALADFLDKIMAGTAPDAGEYSQLPAIVMLHNGAAKIGDFIVEDSGRIMLVDPTTGKPRLVFSVTDLPTLATLASGTTYSGTVNIPSDTTSTSDVLTGSINVTQAGSTVNFQASLLELTASANSTSETGLVPAATATLELLRNGDYYAHIGQVGVQVPLGGSNYDSKSINKSISGCPAGTYTVRLVVTKSPDINSAYSDISASVLSWNFTQSGVRYMQMGLNGLMAYFSNNHLYFTENGGLDLRGATNMPGILLSGVVGSTGGFTLWWGHKKAAGTATKTATGTYTVYHAVGHVYYAVLITSEWGGHTAHVLNKGNSSFDVKIYTDAGALVDAQFSFAIVGNNYP